MIKRNKLGRYVKGIHYSPKTEFTAGHNKGIQTRFRKGQHSSKATEFRKVWTDKQLRERRLIYGRRWRKQNQKKVKSQYLAQKINIPKGQMCVECNKEKARLRHHEDYSKPYKIKFVCYRCHNKKLNNRGNFAKEFRI
jgi:superfamily II helicase